MSAINQTIQYLAWFLALIGVIVGLYALLLNPRHSANRHVSVLFFLTSANLYGLGALIGARTAQAALFPSLLMALAAPTIPIVFLITTLVLLKPVWLTSKGNALAWVLYPLSLAPASLTTADQLFHAGLWFTPLTAPKYAGGFASLSAFCQGLLAPLVKTFYINGLPFLVLAVLIWLAWRSKSAGWTRRALTWVLLVAQVLSLAMTLTMEKVFTGPASLLIGGAAFLAAFGYATFQEMISERRLQRTGLQTRLTLLVMAVSLPVLVAVSTLGVDRAKQQMEQDAVSHLGHTNMALSATITTWVNMNVEVLQELAARPEIQSMDAALQKPSLEKAAAAFNHMYLISTTDLTGFNIARNDQEAPKDYKDRAWFQGAVAGNPVTYQTLVGRTSGQPALVVSVPVRNPQGNIAGVLMFASDLGVLSNQVQASRIGKSGYAYVIDANNQVVAHPDRSYSAQLKDLSDYPPVVALRTGARGEFPFTDEQGVQWIANLNVLPNNWAVIVQAPRSELLSSVTIFEHISWLVLLVGSGLLFLMAWLTIRQGFRPVQTLSETVRAVSAGDLTRRAPIESQDEIGLLAQSFNNMAGQLQELISGLEQRVSDRTHQLERRAVELQVLAEVAREAAAIRDLEGLLEKTVHLISDRFGYDHAGIFLVDETGEYAVLRAASSTGGKRMLARGHRLRIGQMGIVGFVAANASPRIALDVGADAVYFDNPDLPDTRSEVGLPLIIHEKVIGVLDVQSMQPAAFSEEDLEIFQMLADQVAVAIENARLLTESQQALKELQSRYGAQVRQAWERRAANRALVFACDQNGVRPITDESAFWKGEVGHYLEAPVLLRDQQLGTLLLRREPGDGPWTSEEKDLITETISQVAQALENARLLNEVQQRAYHEQLVNEITTRAQSSLNIETVMKTAVEEIGRVVGASKIQVRLRAEAGSRNGS